MKRSGRSDFWSLAAAGPKYLPRETREYVPMILAAMIIARNPLQYGFDVMAAEPIAYDKVAIPRAVDLRRVAEWAGTASTKSRRSIRNCGAGRRRCKYPEYEVKVPVGSAERSSARLAEAGPSDLHDAEVVHGEARRDAARPSRASSRVSRSGARRGEQPEGEVGGACRSGADHPESAGHDGRRPRRARGAERRRVALAVSSAPARRRPGLAAGHADHLSRQARRHALVDRASSSTRASRSIKSWNRLHGSSIAAGTRLKILASAR